MSLANLYVYRQNISTARQKIAQIYLQYLHAFPSLKEEDEKEEDKKKEDVKEEGEKEEDEKEQEGKEEVNVQCDDGR